MSTIIITSDNDSDLKKILEFAKKLKLKASKMTLEDIEDIALYHAIEEGRSGEYVSEEEIMKTVKEQKKKIANGSKI